MFCTRGKMHWNTALLQRYSKKRQVHKLRFWHYSISKETKLSSVLLKWPLTSGTLHQQPTWVLEGRKSYIELYIIMGTHVPLWVWCAILNAPENKIVVLCLIIFLGKKCMQSNLYFLSKMWLCSWGAGGREQWKPTYSSNIYQMYCRLFADVTDWPLSPGSPSGILNTYLLPRSGWYRSLRCSQLQWLFQGASNENREDKTNTKASVTCAIALWGKYPNNTRCRAACLLMERHIQ